MSVAGGVTRWWENYLVRYLMPSIAGVVIVVLLASIAGADFQKLLLLPQKVSEINGPSLLLLFLYGNLFCYVASYPILTFHVSRVLDFREARWPNSLLDGYIWTLLFGIATGVLVWWFAESVYSPSYFLAVLFVLVQLLRLSLASYRRVALGRISLLYGYALALARRRGERDTTPEAGELVETYRHMREHGNSAYIFFLELILAALVYGVLKKPCQTGIEQLSSIGVLFAIWAVPAVFVHLVAQYLERQFSRYD